MTQRWKYVRRFQIDRLLFLALRVLGGCLALGRSIFHLGVGLLLSLLGLFSLLGFLLGLALGLFLGALLRSLLFLGLFKSLTLSVELLPVALNDRASDEANLVELGYVDGLCGVITLFVEPVLERC